MLPEAKPNSIDNYCTVLLIEFYIPCYREWPAPISLCWYNILCVCGYGAGQFIKISETFEYYFVEIMNLYAKVSTHCKTVCSQVLKKYMCRLSHIWNSNARCAILGFNWWKHRCYTESQILLWLCHGRDQYSFFPLVMAAMFPVLKKNCLRHITVKC